MKAHVLSTNIASPFDCPNEPHRKTGIHKVAVDSIELLIPGPDYGDGSGVVGDFVGDTKHHSGADKAVYAFAREELDYWQNELGQEFAHGSFGENLTTRSIVWADTVVGTVFRVGDSLLQVSVPRTPCRTFADWLQVRGWMKKITQRGEIGAYLRVVQPGTISPFDELELVEQPCHAVTMGQAFAAKMGNKDAARLVLEHEVLPEKHLEQLRKLVR